MANYKVSMKEDKKTKITQTKSKCDSKKAIQVQTHRYINYNNNSDNNTHYSSNDGIHNGNNDDNTNNNSIIRYRICYKDRAFGPKMSASLQIIIIIIIYNIFTTVRYQTFCLQ
jgi:hypothetical protein